MANSVLCDTVQRLCQGTFYFHSIISTRVTAISLTPYEKYGLQCGGRGEKKLESTNRNSFMLLCEVWLSLFWFSQNSHSFHKYFWTHSVPHYFQIRWKIQKIQIKFHAHPSIKKGFHCTYLHQTQSHNMEKKDRNSFAPLNKWWLSLSHIHESMKLDKRCGHLRCTFFLQCK